MDKRFGKYAGCRVFNFQKKQGLFKNISNIKQSIMKRIIYTAVALIICASVFGITDYISAKKQGTLVNYTDDEQTTEAIAPEKKKEITTVAKEEILIPTGKKEFKKELKEKTIVKTKVNDLHYTSVEPNLIVTEKTKDLTELTSKVYPMDVLQAKVTDDNKNDSIVPETNKRKISLELFSRAPIREKRIKAKK